MEEEPRNEGRRLNMVQGFVLSIVLGAALWLAIISGIAELVLWLRRTL